MNLLLKGRTFARWAIAALTLLAGPAHALPEAQVVVSITSNAPNAPQFNVVEVTRKPIGSQSSGSAFELTPLLRGVSTDTMVYGRSLPAGEYEITSLRQTVLRKLLLLNDAARQVVGRFVVAEGQSIDLGRLVLTSVNENLVLGRSRQVTDNQDLLQHHERKRWTEFLAPSKGQPPLSGWVDGPSPNDDVESYATRRPNGFQRPTEGADGRVVAASRMGTVLVRSRAGKWTLLVSGRLETLNHALPVDSPDTATVAVGELGLILRQPAGSPLLKVVDPGNLPRGNLRFIAGAPTTGWVVALERGDKLRLMQSTQLEAGNWTLLREVDVSPLLRERGSQVWWWPMPNGFALATPRGPIAHYDRVSFQWTEHRTPQGYPLLNLVPGHGAQLTAVTYSASGLAGEHAIQFRSADHGATWERLGGIPHKGRPFPDAPISLKDGTLLLQDGDPKLPMLKASQDGGATWQSRKVTFNYSRFFTMPSGLLIAQLDGGSVWLDVSQDGGLNWTNEHNTFDSAAYQAQKARETAKPTP